MSDKNELPALPEDVPAQPEGGASTDEELIDGQWRQGTWQDLPMLTCQHCGWDTLEGIGVAREHARTCQRCHPVMPTPPPPLVQAYDRWGNPIDVRRE